MYWNRCIHLLAMLLLMAAASWVLAADIAIVDFADEWNKQACVGQLLGDLGQDYDDITTNVESGSFSLKGYRMFIIGSFVTNSATLHNSLDDNADEIRSFIADGGVVIELTQADQNQANVDWLPEGVIGVRSDTDYAQINILESAHPIFNTPNKLTEEDLSNWQISSGGWSTAWETFVVQMGFTVLAARDAKGTNPCILETVYGNGRILLLSIALDKKHVLGTTPESTENSMLLMENILAEYITSNVEASGKLATVWGKIKAE